MEYTIHLVQYLNNTIYKIESSRDSPIAPTITGQYLTHNCLVIDKGYTIFLILAKSLLNIELFCTS
jgi:hypothetical protein